MKKVLVGFAMMMAALTASAGTMYVDRYNNKSALITPDVATDYTVLSSDKLNKDSKGNTVYCPKRQWMNYENQTCLNEQGMNKWIYFKQAIPAGRTLVGFEVRHDSIVLYWK